MIVAREQLEQSYKAKFNELQLAHQATTVTKYSQYNINIPLSL